MGIVGLVLLGVRRTPDRGAMSPETAATDMTGCTQMGAGSVWAETARLHAKSAVLRPPRPPTVGV